MQIYKQAKKTQRKRRLFLSILGAILIAFAAFGAVFFSPLKEKFFSKNDTPTQTVIGPNSTVDYSGPSESDILESQNAKKDEAKTNANPTPSHESKKVVPVAVSFADMYNNNLEVRAFISGIIEGNGTCTITATKAGSPPITESTPAFIDTSTTQCEPLYIARARLSTGVWKVVVTFSSPDAQGNSEVVEVNVR